jgi:hypothetical protein
MTPELQTTISLALFVGAVAFFVIRWIRARKKPGCGGGCGCGKKLRD